MCDQSGHLKPTVETEIDNNNRTTLAAYMFSRDHNG